MMMIIMAMLMQKTHNSKWSWCTDGQDDDDDDDDDDDGKIVGDDDDDDDNVDAKDQ